MGRDSGWKGVGSNRKRREELCSARIAAATAAWSARDSLKRPILPAHVRVWARGREPGERGDAFAEGLRAKTQPARCPAAAHWRGAGERAGAAAGLPQPGRGGGARRAGVGSPRGAASSARGRGTGSVGRATAASSHPGVPDGRFGLSPPRRRPPPLGARLPPPPAAWSAPPSQPRV